MAERIAAAADEAGIGLTLLPVFYARAGFGGAPARAEQRRFVNDLDSYAALVAACRRALGDWRASASRRTRCAPRRRTNSPPSCALGATGRSTSTSPSRPPRSRPAWRGPARARCAGFSITPRSTGAGASSTRRISTRTKSLALARSGAVAGLCPITEANLGDGVFPARAFLDAGGRFGVGTDSNVEIALAGELRMLEYSQRLTLRARNVCARQGGSTGAALFAAAAAGGAQALGRPAGLLAPGAVADIVSLDAASPRLAGRADDADSGHLDFRRRAGSSTASGAAGEGREPRAARRAASRSRPVSRETLRRLAAGADA